MYDMYKSVNTFQWEKTILKADWRSASLNSELNINKTNEYVLDYCCTLWCHSEVDLWPSLSISFLQLSAKMPFVRSQWPLTFDHQKFTSEGTASSRCRWNIACTRMAEIWMLCAVWVGTVDRVNDKDPACTAETSAETRGFKITTSLRFNISGSLLSQTKNRNSAVTSRATDVGETTSQWWGQRPNEWRTQHH